MTWWKVAKNKRIHASDDNRTFICGVGVDHGSDIKYTKKPRTGIFCKNCLRVINKK